jgi:hypothetical protein
VNQRLDLAIESDKQLIAGFVILAGFLILLAAVESK